MLIAVGNFDLFWNSNACGKGRTKIQVRQEKTKQIFSSCWNPSSAPPPPNTPCYDRAVIIIFFFSVVGLTEKQHAITFLKQPSWNVCQMSVERELTYQTLLHDGNSTPFA